MTQSHHPPATPASTATDEATGVTLRPLLHGDIPTLTRLLAAVELVDRTGEHYNEADLAEELANPDLELGKDVIGVFDGDEVVGYFLVFPRSADETHQKFHAEGSVRPDRRGAGIGTRLVRGMLARADQVHAATHGGKPMKVHLAGPSDNVGQQRLLTEAGFVPERWNFVMRTHLDAVPEPAPLSGGLELRTYDASLSAAMQAAHNEAFLDHPNFAPWTDVMWGQWVTQSRSFRPGLSFVVSDTARSGRVVAYLQTNEHDANFAATGRREAYVAKVGTLREYRGRGLAGALLRRALSAYRDAGFDEAALDVDSDNPTGALSLYRRAGFEVESRWTNYVLTRPARTT